MLSGRLADATVDRTSRGERSWTAIAVIGVLVAVAVPALIALGTGVWSPRPAVQASEPAPEIESASADDRPSVGAVPSQTASHRSADPESRGRSAGSSEPGRRDSAAATGAESGGSIPSPPSTPAPEPRSSAPRSEPQAPVSAPSTFAPVAASEPGRLDLAAATRGGSGGSIPSPPGMSTPEPRSSAPRVEPQAPVPDPSAFARAAEEALASAAGAEALVPSSPPHKRAPAGASDTLETTPALDPASMAAGGYWNGQPLATPPRLTRNRRSARQRPPVAEAEAPAAAVAPAPVSEAAVPSVPPPSFDDARRPDRDAAGRTPEPLTAPRATPVQQPRAPDPVPVSTAGVARVSPQPQGRAPVSEQASSAVVAPPPHRQRDEDRLPDLEAAARDAFKEASVRVGQTRALAEAADAPNLASGSFQAAVALQREALELSKSGRLLDASKRLVEANGRFRLAEAEARLKAVARDRSPVAGAPTPVPRLPAEPREAPAPPAGSSPGESRPPAAAPVPRAIDAQNAVRQVIALYVRGLENRSVADLKRVWPSLAGSQERAIQAEFDNARSVKAAFNDPQITINGDTSTVAGMRTYAVVTQDGHRLSRSTKTTLTLRRTGEGWLIERVVHQ
jgi:SnoaL-like protein